MNDEAIEVLKQGIEIDPSNEDMHKLLEETKIEWEEDHNIPEDHPQQTIIKNMLNWLKEGGSTYDKMKIRFYSADYRGVHAAKNIKKGETILHVPKEQVITLEMAMNSPVGRKMYEKGLRQRLISPKHSFLCTYIMQERRNPDSYWNPYMDILPKQFTNFPVFFTEEEKKWLVGSPFLD
jgi:histone-lysine N-methyltransferase SETD3